MGVCASVSRRWCIKTVRPGRWTAFPSLNSLKSSGGEFVWAMALNCPRALVTSTNTMASKMRWVRDAKSKNLFIIKWLIDDKHSLQCIKFIFLCIGLWEDLRVLQSQLQSGADRERYVREGLELGHSQVQRSVHTFNVWMTFYTVWTGAVTQVDLVDCCYVQYCHAIMIGWKNRTPFTICSANCMGKQIQCL